jgi:probable addiction module antidote protein
MEVKTRPFDPAFYLNSDAGMAEYMSAALATNDRAFIANALRVVARARGMTHIPCDAALSWEALEAPRGIRNK